MNMGIPDKVVASMLGHDAQTLKEIYQHSSAKMEEIASKQIDNIFNGK